MDNLIVLNIAEYDTCFTRLTDISRCFIPENRTEEQIGDVFTTRYHGSKIFGSQQTVVLQIPGCKYGRKDEKIDMEDFPVHG